MKRFFICTFLIGILSRLLFTQYFPLNFDELIQYDVLNIVDSQGVFSYLKDHERQGPLVYFLYFPLIKMFPQNLMALRILGVFMGLLTLYFYFHLSKSLFKRDRFKVLFSCSLFSLCFYPLLFTYTIRPYGALVLMTSITAFLLSKVLSHYKNEDWNSFWKVFGALLVSCIFLGLSHPFGLLQVLLYAFATTIIVIRKFNIPKNFPFLFISFLGLAIFSFLLFLSYALEYRPLGFHPSHWPPDFFKVSGALVHMASGHLNFVIFLFCLFIVHIRQKRISGFSVNGWGLLFFGAPLVFAYLFSHFIFPIFELRYFGHLTVFFSLLLTDYLFLATSSRSTVQLLLCSIILVSTFLFTFHHKRLLGINAPMSFFKIFEDLPALKEKVVLNCGNCPSFYFDKNKIQCRGGWDFSLDTDKNPDVQAEAFILFKKNTWFCEKYIPKGWVKHDYPEVEVYLPRSTNQ